MDIGFEFNVMFNKELDEIQQDRLWYDFVNFIEKNKMYWGGGHSRNDIKLRLYKQGKKIPRIFVV
jgi:uncharacterized protein YggL (DUF469 family)